MCWMKGISRHSSPGALAVFALLGILTALPGRSLAEQPAKKPGPPDRHELWREAKLVLHDMAVQDGYGLAKNQNVRRVVPPFPERRAEYVRLDESATGISPKWAKVRPNVDPVSMTFYWDNGGLREHTATWADDQDLPLVRLLDAALDIRKPMVIGKERLLDTCITGDWVVRAGADREELVKELGAILEKELKLPITLTLRAVDRPVYVVTGTYKYNPYPEALDDQSNTDRILLLDPKTMKGDDCTFDGEYEMFLDSLAQHIGRPVISEVRQSPDKRLSWRWHNNHGDAKDRDEDRDPNLVLNHVTIQTGLKFQWQERKMTILFVEDALNEGK